MKTRAFAAPPVRLGCIGLLAVSLCLYLSRATQAAEPQPSVGGTVDVAYLEYQVASQPLRTWGFTLNLESKAFQKEPDTGRRKVCRGSFQLTQGSSRTGSVPEEPTCFLWDYKQGKLYLDLNHNRDLTDDAEGVFTYPVSRFSYYAQTFKNVQLKVKTPAGDCPVAFNLNLYNPDRGQPYGNVAYLSWWAGKITLRGHEYQIGRADEGGRLLGMADKGYLLLRPWEERDRPWDLVNGALDAFTFSPNLFFAGQAYRVDCSSVQQDGKLKYKVSFHEKEVELGELKLTGEFIERLVLVSSPLNRNRTPEPPPAFTVVLDHPGKTVNVPAGAYHQFQVLVTSGGISAHNVFSEGSSRPPVVVAQNAAAPPIEAGGPLTNSVKGVQQGRTLTLNYELLGSGGIAYQLCSQDRSKPPGFTIYRNGKAIHSGRFEFG